MKPHETPRIEIVRVRRRPAPAVALLSAAATILAVLVPAAACHAGFGPTDIQPAAVDSTADGEVCEDEGGWLQRNLKRHFGAGRRAAAPTGGGFVDSERRFMRYRGMIINEIHFTRERLSAGVATGGESRLRRAAEATHVDTRESVLRRHLLFREGDRVNPWVLADYERILRSLPFIDEAWIFVLEDSENPIHVDLEVVTRDRWSLGAAFRAHDAGDIEVDIFERNFLGLGHNLENEFRVRGDEQPNPGYEGSYTIYNLGGTFVDTRLDHFDTPDEALDRIDIERRMISPRMRVLGGLGWSRRLRRDDEHSLALGGVDHSRVRERHLWLAHAFAVGPHESARHTLTLAAGVYERKWQLKPEAAATASSRYDDYRRYLSRLTWAENTHFQGSYVRGFGRIEDIPRGFMLSLLGGYEDGSFAQRSYLGFELGRADVIRKLGYFSARVGIGGFRDEDAWQESALDISLDYYSNLAEQGSWLFRQFLGLDYVHGWQRREGEHLLLGDDHGIDFLPGGPHRGQRRLVLNWESVFFTPASVAGFRLVAFAFGDAGVVGASSQPLFTHPVHAGCGIGLRIKNESLVLRTIELRFSFFPGPSVGDNFGWNLASGDRALPNAFYRVEPGIIEYD